MNRNVNGTYFQRLTRIDDRIDCQKHQEFVITLKPTIFWIGIWNFDEKLKMNETSNCNSQLFFSVHRKCVVNFAFAFSLLCVNRNFCVFFVVVVDVFVLRGRFNNKFFFCSVMFMISPTMQLS